MGWGTPFWKEIVARQTVPISRRRQRHHVVFWAEWARYVRGARIWNRPNEALPEHYINNPMRYGQYMVENKAFPVDLQTRLKELRAAQARTEPFLVVRGLYPTKFWWWQYAGKFKDDFDPETTPFPEDGMPVQPAYIKDSIYDIISSGLIEQLGAKHKKKDESDTHLHRNYFTSYYSAVDQFTSDADLPLRFRNAVPEFRFEDDPRALESSLTARYALYVCVENPLRDPIYVLGTDHVAALLSQATKNLLEDSQYKMFDHWFKDLRDRYRADPQRVMESTNTDTGEVARISFDANRIWIDAETHVENRAAVAQLREMIQEAGAKHAIRVVLARGDVLIVDNYRALVRRTQNTNAPSFAWTKETRRWLRVYYGFPPKPAVPAGATKLLSQLDLSLETTRWGNDIHR